MQANKETSGEGPDVSLFHISINSARTPGPFEEFAW